MTEKITCRECDRPAVYKNPQPLCKYHYNKLRCNDAVKDAQRKYRESNKGIDANAKYESTEKARERKRKYKRKIDHPEDQK